MKRWMLVIALLSASPAYAVVDELAVRLWPEVKERPYEFIRAHSWTNSNRAEFRAELLRQEGDQLVPVEKTPSGGQVMWVSSATGAVLMYPGPGDYRLRVYASEGPGTPERMVSRQFRVLDREDPLRAVALVRHDIASAYESVRDCWQDEVASLRRREFLMLDLSTSLGLIGERGWLWCQWEHPHYDAPGGGDWTITGAPGDGDATGAVVVSGGVVPSREDELRQLNVGITLPAYPGVPDLVRRTKFVTWEPGIVDPDRTISDLSLKIFPSGAEFALDGTPIPMWATVEGGKATFAYELERWDGSAYLREESWQGDSMIRWSPRRAGQYRVRVTATEEGDVTVLQKTQTFRVFGPRHPDYDRIRARNTVDRNFEVALAYVRNTFYRVSRRMIRQDDVFQAFFLLQEGRSVAWDMIHGMWGGSQLAAPGGGPAFIGGVAGDGDATGAIVLEVAAPPAEDYDWAGTTVNIIYPAYAPAGRSRRTVTVRY